MKTPRAAPAGNIVLAQRLSIAQAVALHRELVGRVAEGSGIVLDGSRVEEIDTAILQLLASLWRSARERGIPCSCVGPSAALRRSAQLVGLAAALDLKQSGTQVERFAT